MAADAAKTAFETSPDSVYGVLVGVLFLISLALSFAVYKVVRAGAQERKEHKNEMKEIYEKHEASDNKKYEDMQALTEKVMTGMEKMTGMIQVLTNKS